MNAVGELVGSQWYVFLAAILLGAALCFCYDLFRVIRRVIPHGIRAVTVEDFLYWVFWTLAVMTMLDALDKGAIRGFSLGAVFLGMLVYLLCFSRIVLRALVFLLGWGKKILRMVWDVFLWPWKKIMIFFRPVVRYNKEKFSAAGEGMRKRRAKKRQAARERRMRREEARERSGKKSGAKETGVFHGKKDARDRKQKQKKEKSHHKNRDL